MPVYNAGTTNIGLRSDIHLNSASAFKIESTSNVSTKEILENHYAPNTGTASNADKFSFISNKAYRVMAIQASSCTVTVVSPTTYNGWKWKSGDSANGTAALSISHADYVTNGRSLYLRGTSYSSYSVITLSIAADYGYSVSSYAFYNSAGAFNAGYDYTGNLFSLYSGTHTGGSEFFMRWFAT